MKLVIESTEYAALIDGVHMRLWSGTTDHGVECSVFVRAISVHSSNDQSEFSPLRSIDHQFTQDIELMPIEDISEQEKTS